jgi:hypothetical protein
VDVQSLALKIGSQLIEAKLQKLAADPFFSNQPALPQAPGPVSNSLPTTNRQKKERSAKVHPPRIITVR